LGRPQLLSAHRLVQCSSPLWRGRSSPCPLCFSATLSPSCPATAPPPPCPNRLHYYAFGGVDRLPTGLCDKEAGERGGGGGAALMGTPARAGPSHGSPLPLASFPLLRAGTRSCSSLPLPSPCILTPPQQHSLPTPRWSFERWHPHPLPRCQA
jgi:hypothetical protein